jgi:hypothetical protein
VAAGFIMTVDVDAVNERLIGLVNLLHVVGIDGVDPDALVKEQKRLTKGEAPSESQARSPDDQILEIIKKLQLAQADSPEILAALKSPELRALASLAAQKQARAEPAKRAPPTLDDVMDDDDNYPKIGPGYSDDISVVSDLTTPTVMTKQQVQEEEYYKDVTGGPGSLPPMNINLGGQAARPTAVGGQHRVPPKTKNLVSQVHPAASRRAIAKTGGAAAQRRLNYQQAMAKLQSTDSGAAAPASGGAAPDKSYMENFSPKKKAPNFFPTPPSPTPDPSEFPSMTDGGGAKKGSKPKKVANTKGRTKDKTKPLSAQEMQDISFGDTEPTSGSSSGSSSKKKSVKKDDKDMEWGTGGGSGSVGASSGAGGGDDGWPAFDAKTEVKKKKPKDTFVDNDGFFAGDAFAGSDPFTSPRKTSKSSVEGDGTKTRKSKDPEKAPKKDREKTKTSKSTKSRRASLTM